MLLKNKKNIALIAASLSLSAGAVALEDSSSDPISEVNRILSTSSTDLNSSGQFSEVTVSNEVVDSLTKIAMKELGREIENIEVELKNLSLTNKTLNTELLRQQSRLNDLHNSIKINTVISDKIYINGVWIGNMYQGLNDKVKFAEYADKCSLSNNTMKLGGKDQGSYARSSHKHNVSDFIGLSNISPKVGLEVINPTKEQITNRLITVFMPDGSRVTGEGYDSGGVKYSRGNFYKTLFSGSTEVSCDLKFEKMPNSYYDRIDHESYNARKARLKARVFTSSEVLFKSCNVKKNKNIYIQNTKVSKVILY